MSGLAAVLAGRHETGVYRWHGAFEVADVRHTVEHAGWRFAYLDGWVLESKAEVLAAMGETFDFPDHYGQNFDALEDCLRDVVAGEAGGTILLWDGWGPFARADERAFLVAVSVLNDRVQAGREGSRGGPFAVLLRGAGPEIEGLTHLDH